MKVFTNSEGCWSSKINFADENNVVLGYDTNQDCCEHADWFVSEEIEQYEYGTDYDCKKEFPSEKYVFDKDFFRSPENGGDLEDGSMVVFKLVSPAEPDLYLHIFNSHNGYCGHGFLFEIDGVTIHEDTL